MVKLVAAAHYSQIGERSTNTSKVRNADTIASIIVEKAGEDIGGSTGEGEFADGSAVEDSKEQWTGNSVVNVDAKSFEMFGIS